MSFEWALTILAHCLLPQATCHWHCSTNSKANTAFSLCSLFSKHYWLESKSLSLKLHSQWNKKSQIFLLTFIITFLSIFLFNVRSIHKTKSTIPSLETDNHTYTTNFKQANILNWTFVTFYAKRDHVPKLVISVVGQKFSTTCVLSILRFPYFRKELSFAYLSVQDGCSTRSQSSTRSVYFKPLVTILHWVQWGFNYVTPCHMAMETVALNWSKEYPIRFASNEG